MGCMYMRYGVLGGIFVCICLFSIRCTKKDTRFASLLSETHYVGNEACASCHNDISKAYAQSPMGHSMYLPDPYDIIEDFNKKQVVHDPASGFSYFPFWQKDSMYIQEFRLEGKDTVYERTERVDYIIGSGAHTRSYLMDRKGYIYEMPITWYSQSKKWDLSPGYEDGNNSRFDREIGSDCLSCHTGEFDLAPFSKNKYNHVSLGIDCERCHGPGSVHAKQMRQGNDVAFSIVNPLDLDINAQFDICQQCHLQGIHVFGEGFGDMRDFRPGMQLAEMGEVFIPQKKETGFGIASQAERLRESACFSGSEGKLTCTTCHDPHEKLESARLAISYAKACISCHEEKKCSAPGIHMLESEDCAGCHMPKGGTSDIPHVRFTDHLIRVPREKDRVSDSVQNFLKMVAVFDPKNPYNEGAAWLEYFEKFEKNPTYLDKAENALDADQYFERSKIAYYKGEPAQALMLMRNYLKKHPSRIKAKYVLGDIFVALSWHDSAYQVFDSIYRQYPSNIEAGIQSGVYLLLARQGEPSALFEAKTLFEELLKEKPLDKRIKGNLGFVYMNLGRKKEAIEMFAQALALDPDYVFARENMRFIEKNTKVGQQY